LSEGVKELVTTITRDKITPPIEHHPQHGVSPKKYTKPSTKCDVLAMAFVALNKGVKEKTLR